MNATFRDVDVAAMLRIAGEVRELSDEDDVHVRRAHILDRLIELIGACGAVCSEVDPRYSNDSGWALSGSITVAGAIAAHEMMIKSYLAGDVAALDPCTPHLLGKGRAAVTFRRADVVDHSWFRSEHFNCLRRPRGIGESVYGSFTTPDGRRLRVTMLRELHDPLFTQRDVQLLHVFNENLAGLYVAPPRFGRRMDDRRSRTDATIASLPPRLQRVLQRLLAGDSEKQVALKLGLSQHTIHEYSKGLYRAFQVNSRGELLAQFVVNP